MRITSRRKSIIFFTALGASLVTIAVALNVSWILLNWREVALLTFGIIFFVAIIAGVVLNTIFLVREIRRNEQHDSFINAVTHELKTPLASIRLYIETLKTRDVDEAKRHEFYDVMLADSEQLLQTIEQVLRAGRSGHRRRRINETTVDLAQLASHCVEQSRLRYKLDADALRFIERANGNRLLVRGDVDELHAAISNLIDNAVKYSDREVDISVEAATDQKTVVLKVTDRGIGIPSEQIKRIFKRFYRVPRPVMVRIKGTGLGLFIVRSIVEKHGGRVTAESEGEGRGSTFTIRLPREEEK
ncbi:MAG: HAMP domain-containing sensor histidine kinase [Acidobacteriota bacterium]